MKSPSVCRVSHAMICNKKCKRSQRYGFARSTESQPTRHMSKAELCFVSCHDHFPAQYRLADAVISIQLGYYNFRFYVAKCCLLRRPLLFKLIHGRWDTPSSIFNFDVLQQLRGSHFEFRCMSAIKHRIFGSLSSHLLIETCLQYKE